MQENNRQNCLKGTLVWGSTILSVLVSPIAAVCGAVIVAPISIIYVFCIVPLDLIRNRTLFNQDNLNFVERNLNRFNKTSSKSLEASDVESGGLHVIEDHDNSSNKVRRDQVDNENPTDTETNNLIASNPVQKSVLPPTYEFIINAASSLTNIADVGTSSKSKSKITVEDDSLDPCTAESKRASFCKKVNEITCELENF